MKNVVFISSKIKVSDVLFIYGGSRSRYTVEERFEQTKKTIESIKKYIPNYFIILLDNSNLDNKIIKYLNDNVDIFLNPKEDENLLYHTDINPHKSCGELAQTKYVIDILVKSKIEFKNFFKITGRYIINDSFDYKIYDNESNIFKIWQEITRCQPEQGIWFYTCFYKISFNNFNQYHQTINDLYLKSSQITKSLEVIMPNYLIDKQIVYNLGITTNIGVYFIGNDNENI